MAVLRQSRIAVALAMAAVFEIKPVDTPRLGIEDRLLSIQWAVGVALRDIAGIIRINASDILINSWDATGIGLNHTPLS
jgi:hypothetical protein